MDKIYELIDETSTLLPIQKDFYKVMITERKRKIIDYSMDLLMRQEKECKRKRFRRIAERGSVCENIPKG